MYDFFLICGKFVDSFVKTLLKLFRW